MLDHPKVAVGRGIEAARVYRCFHRPFVARIVSNKRDNSISNCLRDFVFALVSVLVVSEKQTEHIHPFFLVMRVVLGVGFLFVGGEKLFRLNSFIDQVAAYRVPGLEYPYDEWAAYAVPSIEIIVGISLIFRLFYRPALLLQGGLVVAFGAAVVHLRRNYPELQDCGCFPWEANHLGWHLTLLVAILVAVIVLWEEDRRLRKHRFKGGKLKLP